MTSNDGPSFAAWVDRTIPNGLGGKREWTTLAGGRSNLTYLLADDEGRRVILRRAPPVGGPDRARNILREAKMLQRMDGKGIPVPSVLGICDDDSVIGTAFYIMEFLDGVILRSRADAESLSLPARETAWRSFLDALVAIHGLEVTDRNISGVPFVERQLQFWRSRWVASGRQSKAADHAHDVLTRMIPRDDADAFLHGDPHLDNAVFSPTGTLRALLDWELWSRGPALIDVAHLMLFWAEPGETPFVTSSEASQAPGFPDRPSLVSAYATRSGREVANLPYYEAFVAWRLACGMSTVSQRSATENATAVSPNSGYVAEHAALVKGDLPYETTITRLAERAHDLSRELL